MSLLDQLERRFRRFAIPNLTGLIVAGQVVGYILQIVNPPAIENWMLIPARVMEGEVWRLILFPFWPPGVSIFVIFALYFFYMMGTVLENTWGVFRFNLFMFVGYLATVGAAFLEPEQGTTNAYLGTSVFLAFALLYPDYRILLFMILPIKAKYLAAVTWFIYAIQFIEGPLTKRLTIAAAVLNIMLFFGPQFLARIRAARRKQQWAAKQVRSAEQPFHRCAVCGANEKTHPQRDFRFCSKCDGAIEYCEEHLKTHEHRHADV